MAESIVDEYLRRDPATSIRVSVTGGRGALFVSGDVVTTADFDVASVIRRTLSSNGILTEIEPFVSLEPATPDLSSFMISGNVSPTHVVGYATDETSEYLPRPVVIARQVVELFERQRTQNEQWFWFGSDAEVVVTDTGKQIQIHVALEHGQEELASVRKQIAQILQPLFPTASIRVNTLGSISFRGLGNVMGASGQRMSIYGDQLPSGPSPVGLHPGHPEKGGMWLARLAAKDLVMHEYAKQALVQFVYDPGERVPSMIRARDSQGTDLSAFVDPERYSLEGLVGPWLAPGLSTASARFGFVGLPDAPWETGG